MRVGIIDMYGIPGRIHHLESTLKAMGFTTVTIDGTIGSMLEKVRQSSIKYWIASGGAHYATDPQSPHIPLGLLNLPNKQFLLICYAMESVLVQLGYPLRERQVHRKGLIRLGPMVIYRNHRRYFATHDLPYIAAYNGETMIAAYKNAILVQFHPEKTVDGRRFIADWLKC
jgi:GMP synthase-like glutamine amidotransferase